jgi:hypothetical protein
MQPNGLYKKHEWYIYNKYGSDVLNRLISRKKLIFNRKPSLYAIEQLINYYQNKLDKLNS